MYTQHFGFDRLPFEASPSSAIYVDLPNHRDALNTILFGLRTGEGFIKVTGEVGTGKTALCKNLLRNLGEDWVTAYLVNPSIDPFDLLMSIADELGVPLPGNYSFHALQKYTREILLDIARTGQRTVIIIDEAQTMPGATLEELRLLSNLEGEEGKLIQVVLFGQPELDEKLSDYSLRQLQQRIGFSARLTPLDRESTRAYIQRRTALAGARGYPIFSRAAIDRIHRSSGGIPRLVNILCHKSLLAAFAEGELGVEKRHAIRAARDTEGIRRWQTRLLFRRSSSAAQTPETPLYLDPAPKRWE